MEISKGTCLSLQSVPKNFLSEFSGRYITHNSDLVVNREGRHVHHPKCWVRMTRHFWSIRIFSGNIGKLPSKKSRLIIRREGFKIPSRRNFPFRGYPLPPSDLHRQHFPENFLQPKVIFGPHFCCRRFLNCNAAESQSIYLHLHSSWFSIIIDKCFEPHLEKSPMSGNNLLETDHQHLPLPANNCKVALFPNLKGTWKF